ncbi:hypothetical protein Peur_037590 [Populus x canadensis]
MANKKKKAGSRRSQLMQHKSLAISQRNDSAVLALAAPSLTVHATVTSNSNSKKRPPVASAAVCSRPIHHVLSSPQGSESHHPGDPSPSINQVFVEDWSSDEDLEEEEVDFDSSVDFDYVGAPSSSSPIVVASPASCQSTPPPPSLAEEILSPPVASPAGGQSTLPPQPLAAKILPTPLETTVLPSSLPSGCRESPPSTVAGNPVSIPGSSKWSDLFLSNRNTASSTKLQHFSLNHLSRTCAISPEDIAPEFDPTSTLSCLSYARVLVEIDLLEEIQHSVEISLPEGPALHQSVVYETLPKYCTFCHVLGHARLLCPKAAASKAKPCHQPLAPSLQAAKRDVLSRLGPQPPLHPPLPQVQVQHADAIPVLSKGDVVSEVALEPTNGWVTVEARRKPRKQVNGKAVVVSEPVLEAISPIPSSSPVCTGPVQIPLVTTPCAARVQASPPPCPDSLAQPPSADKEQIQPSTPATTAGDDHMPGPPIPSPIVGKSVLSRVLTRNQKKRGGRDRISPPITC